MTTTARVELKRVFPVGKARLFELLTTANYMERWFSPAPEIRLEVHAHEARVGSPYEFHYHQPDGAVHHVVGKYCALEPHDLIAFTWGWKEPDPHAGINTLVTMTLHEQDSQTELTVLHEQLPLGEMADRHREGWAGTLDRLAVLTAGDNR